MIIYSAISPVFDSEIITIETFSKTENGITSFYEKDFSGNHILKFSTEPQLYLKSNIPLQEFTKS